MKVHIEKERSLRCNWTQRAIRQIPCIEIRRWAVSRGKGASKRDKMHQVQKFPSRRVESVVATRTIGTNYCGQFKELSLSDS